MIKNIFSSALLIFLSVVSDVGGTDRIIRLATHESPPYTGSSLKDRGVITKIVTMAFAREGYETQITIVPWKRGFEGTKAGVYDGLFGCWYREQRKEWFIYSKPLIANEIIFLKKRGSPISFDGNYNLLSPYTIGYIRGYAYPPEFEATKDRLKTEMVDVNLQNLEKLKRARVDLIMIDRLISRHLIATKFSDDSNAFEEMAPVLVQDMNYLVISKKTLDFQVKSAAFNRGLVYLKKSGIMEEIFKSHGYSQETSLLP